MGIMKQAKQKAKQASKSTLSRFEDAVVTQLGRDVKSALLIVSLVINLFILTTWVTLLVTNQFDSQLSAAIFTR